MTIERHPFVDLQVVVAITVTAMLSAVGCDSTEDVDEGPCEGEACDQLDELSRCEGFTGHVAKSIELNLDRLPRYADVTDDQSVSVSTQLLAFETASLLVAGPLDLLASPFRAAGIPLLCDDFVPIDTAPDFEAQVPDPPDPSGFVDVPIDDWVAEFDAVKTDFVAVHELAVARIEELSAEPRMNCLLRHLLESIARVAHLAPTYQAMAKQKKLLLSPTKISSKLLAVHILALSRSHAIDIDAAPLQAAGTPIVCNDLPPIPVAPTLGLE